jgi:hypothetical protein
MTFDLDDVKQAVSSLKARGQVPSHRAILGEVGGSSKRKVAVLVHQLLAENPAALDMPAPASTGIDVDSNIDPDPAPEPTPALLPAPALMPWQRPYLGPQPAPVQVTAVPAPAPELPPARAPEPAPTSDDPVARAEGILAERSLTLDRAREALSLAVWDALLFQGLMVKALRYGFSSDDPDGPQMTLVLTTAQRAYGLALEGSQHAEQELAQAQRVHHRRAKERYVQTTQPQLWADVEEWQAKLLRASSDRMAAEAKKNVQAARYKYELAVSSAPTNGHRAP